MSFELTFLGASGGPVDGTTCAMLVKPCDVSYRDIIENDAHSGNLLCVDAGAGLSLIAEIIYQETTTTSPPTSKVLEYYPDSLAVNEYLQTSRTTPFALLRQMSPFQAAQEVCCKLDYLITHPHLDHVAGMVVNLAGFSMAKPKTIHASQYTVDALQAHIFNGIIWPNMPHYKVLDLQPHPFNTRWRSGIFDITMFELSHGRLSSECDQSPRTTETDHYVSSSFLVTNTTDGASVLIFGDCEGDSVSKTTTNLRIWQHVAPLVVNKLLKGMVLECSNCNGIKENELYGHMVPDHLIAEFKALEAECAKVSGAPQPLSGFNIIINHVKEPVIGGGAEMKNYKETELQDPRRRVLSQLNELNARENLGIKFSIALSGITLVI
ncbi:3',5'-cyclic-nucleotide phosphodiesterase (3':5'-CNP) [Suhomyces tanzawaensis NRRL Y-17324]|uniref:3',5'-cyclic-nucleotide phosphodiesterase (3':5'-CNP) n=1 Tax=Suhomyces tanzawaensis NRRL Y-17324 TaxID=984487 RepID=A0A1E4SHY2_9ASCO|nr:3',5'-cyclic-nucleotide phosphodiesterase (3':5'-CNP) [Suhomyces tanzawaensis NRRL Y-17324]ODV79128.1 3',5'-cyclic-nucleotide phosphodiesterase (3':5'-CNP) [Suhomyces tanzawaensis NRRL Y-17324]